MGLRVRMRQVLPEPAAALVAVACLQSSRWGNLGVAQLNIANASPLL